MQPQFALDTHYPRPSGSSCGCASITGHAWVVKAIRCFLREIRGYLIPVACECFVCVDCGQPVHKAGVT